MSGKSQVEVQHLLTQRDRLLAEIEASKNKLAGLEMAIDILRKEGDGGPAETSKRRGSITQTVLDLLRESARNGLKAEEVVRRAAGRGVLLKRASISSLLSQLKRDGVLMYKNHRYKLSEFGPRAERSSIDLRREKPLSDDETRPHH